jgi:hypothetical protein
MDADFLSDLQSLLQKKAVADGIDIGDHGAWDAWLGNNVVACQIRNENRTLLN